MRPYQSFDELRELIAYEASEVLHDLLTDEVLTNIVTVREEILAEVEEEIREQTCLVLSKPDCRMKEEGLMALEALDKTVRSERTLGKIALSVVAFEEDLVVDCDPVRELVIFPAIDKLVEAGYPVETIAHVHKLVVEDVAEYVAKVAK